MKSTNTETKRKQSFMILNKKTEQVKAEVFKLLSSDKTGHGIEHITRVLELSLDFAEKENAEKQTVALIALLHDVDDYKIFGKEKSEELFNARKIMCECEILSDVQNEVISAVKTLGYSKRLKGIEPKTLEAKIVSDADMCDALGVSGFLRTYQYSLSIGRPFFVRSIFPRENLTAENYTDKSNGTGVGHLFEKILKLKDLMLTESGKAEAICRHEITKEMLLHFFIEQNAPEWVEYLNLF